MCIEPLLLMSLTRAELPLNIDKWTVRDVSRYFEATPECCQYASIFSEQEVDGAALLLLTHDSLVKCLGIKLGPALKVSVLRNGKLSNS